MSVSSEIEDFLTRKENLKVALEVADYVEEMKRQTHRDFWDALNHELALRVESELPGRWVYTPFNLRRLRNDWETTYFKMVIPKKDPAPQLLHFGLGQDSRVANFRLYCGVYRHPSVKAITTTLRGLLVSINLANISNDWVGWGHLPITPFTEEFINSVYNHRDEFIQASAQLIWEKFTRLLPEIEAVNQQLLQEQA